MIFNKLQGNPYVNIEVHRGDTDKETDGTFRNGYLFFIEMERLEFLRGGRQD